ncbi:MAG: N-acetyl-gamma-glutamyl-phosphate reductase [Phycisphaerae bacterium]|nr:N-acetyl-gamma-glutamyl-phosphate reductase [Phycisphaerae bacterium]
MRCAVVGAGGYTGAELVSILLGHPRAEVVGVFGSDRRGEGEPTPLSSVFPSLRRRCDLPLRPASADAIAGSGAEVVFLCTPHAVSHDLAPALLARGMKVFDLSAAFRLKEASLYPKHYGFEHGHAEWLRRAAYGIPELFRREIAQADLVAVAGCYPTSAILPLSPLMRAGAAEEGRRPIVDSVSGVSGAGRHATTANLFCEVSLQPYNVLKHRHNPEIDAYAGAAVVFTPHLGCFDRGILSTMHVDLAPGWDATRVGTALRSAYQMEPFVRLLPAGEWPSIAAARHSNFCDIGWAVDETHRHLVIVSAIDNLVKGAAGQAVQCMNARFALAETMGLLAVGTGERP